jgi:hypothetical protein
MTCPNCGRENAADAAYCSNCGTALSAQARPESEPGPAEPGPPEAGAEDSQTERAPVARPTETLPPATPWGATTPAGPPPPPRPRWNPLAGWRAALVWAVVAFVALVILGQATAFLLSAAIEEEPGVEAQAPSTGDTVKIGALYVAFANRTALVAEGSPAGLGDLGLPTGGDGGTVALKVSFGLLGFTALALWLLYRGGRAAGARAGGPAWGRALAGATVALPYAVLTLILAFFTTFDTTLDVSLAAGAPTTGRVELHPSYLGAFAWPFALAAVAGALGGLRGASVERAAPASAPAETPAQGPGGPGPWGSPGTMEPAVPRARSPWWSRVSGALAGGIRMFLFGLLFAYIGFQITAFARDDVDLPFGPGYFEQLGEVEGLQATVITEHVVATIPNQAMLVLVPSMGACDEVDASGLGFRIRFDFLCYAHFPDQLTTAPPAQTGAIAPRAPEFGSAPAINYLFLLVPLLATILGGRAAARRAAAVTRGEGALAGAMAGVVFGVLILLAILLSRMVVDVGGAFAGLSGSAGVTIGPELLLGTVLALAWGAAGGSVGGLWGARPAPPSSEAAWTEAPPTGQATARS